MEFENVKEFKNYFLTALKNGEIKNIFYLQVNPFWIQQTKYKTVTSDKIINNTVSIIHIKTDKEDNNKSIYKLSYKLILKVNNKPIKILH